VLGGAVLRESNCYFGFSFTFAEAGVCVVR
jgi:hypothetical protein